MTHSVLSARAGLAWLSLSAVLAACGGGSGGDDAAGGGASASAASGDIVAPLPVAAVAALPEEGAQRRRGGTAPAPSPAPSPAPAPAPAPVSSTAATTCGIANFSTAALARINQYRAAGASCGSRGSFAPTAALSWNALLTRAAVGHSQDMAAKNYFSHTSPSGATMVSRIDATGYRWSNLGENIAAGYAGIDRVVAGWMASEGHCANIMNPAFRDVGLACTRASASSNYASYWTMDLGKPR